jgi:hypothetical protein
MRRSTSTLILYLSAVFVSGAVVGAIGHQLYTAEMTVRAGGSFQRPSPEEWRREYIGMMSARLDLSAQQIDQLNTILDQARDRFVSLEHEVIRPQEDAIRSNQNESIKSILTEAQLSEYAKMMQEWEEHRKKWAERHKHEGRKERK